MKIQTIKFKLRSYLNCPKQNGCSDQSLHLPKKKEKGWIANIKVKDVKRDDLEKNTVGRPELESNFC